MKKLWKDLIKRTVNDLQYEITIVRKETIELKKKFNMLNIDENDQEELFRILESNNSIDSLEDDFSSSSNSCYHSTDDSSDSLIVKIGCRDSCYNVIKSVNVLTKSEENESLLIKLISQIENPKLQKEYLDKLKKNLIKDETSKKLKSMISFEETLERFIKKKSEDLIVVKVLFLHLTLFEYHLIISL